jgi:hypothetical protein
MMRFENARAVIEEVGARLVPGMRIEGRPVRDTGAFAAWWFKHDDIPNDVGCKRVAKWKKRGCFPTDTYLLMSERLRKEHKIECPPSVWGMKVKTSKPRAQASVCEAVAA